MQLANIPKNGFAFAPRTAKRCGMNDQSLRIGTRGSPLALTQARMVRGLLADAFPDAPKAEIVPIRTTGDAITDRSLADAGGKGLFTKEIDRALLDREVDIAVHSAKDMETWLAKGTVIGAALERGDPRDALIGAPSIAAIPRDAKVGTASQRRQAQLLAQRPDLDVVLFRGNVETRLRKLADGEVDVTLLALAGLNRLGHPEVADAILETDEMLPAAGQGIIAIARRDDNETAARALAPLNDPDTMACLLTERAMLDALDGTCRTPIGGLARILGDGLTLDGLVAWPDGSGLERRRKSGDRNDPVALGRAVGLELRAAIGPDFFAALD